MDGHRFDEFTRRLAGRYPENAAGVVSRRAVLGAVVGGLLGAVTGHGAAARQAACGNRMCGNNPAVCTAGCVCCVYANGNSRCRPPGSCSPGTVACPPGQVLGPSGTCTTPSTTTAAPTTPPPATTASPATTTSTPTTIQPPPTTATPTTTLPPAPQTYGAPCGTGAQCQSGVCTLGSCDCTPAERACNGRCIPGLACCTDDDCGFDSICQRAACNQSTNSCEVVNADSDPRCGPNACGTFACVGGACAETGISVKPFSACFEYVCDPVAGWVKGAAKACTAPGPCQTTQGATCVEENLRGCVYPSTCALCERCEEGRCVVNCATTPGCNDRLPPLCNRETGFCEYYDNCGRCKQCVLGTCRDVPNGTETVNPANGQRGTCCFGTPSIECIVGFCPVGGVCCNSVDDVVVDGRCCPAGSVAYCGGALIDGECCDRECACTLSGCFCPRLLP